MGMHWRIDFLDLFRSVLVRFYVFSLRKADCVLAGN